MCGISGAISLTRDPVPKLSESLGVMNMLLAHRGPDGEGMWISGDGRCGLAHRRLAIIDLSSAGHQPMVGQSGHVLTFNGEIYNYRELMRDLDHDWTFRSRSDSETETILAAYSRWGADALSRLRGMFFLRLVRRR